MTLAAVCVQVSESLIGKSHSASLYYNAMQPQNMLRKTSMYQRLVIALHFFHFSQIRVI